MSREIEKCFITIRMNQFEMLAHRQVVTSLHRLIEAAISLFGNGVCSSQ